MKHLTLNTDKRKNEIKVGAVLRRNEKTIKQRGHTTAKRILATKSKSKTNKQSLLSGRLSPPGHTENWVNKLSINIKTSSTI